MVLSKDLAKFEQFLCKIGLVCGQRSFWANKNRALIEGALFEIGSKRALIEGALFEIGSKRALSEDLGSFSMGTNPRRALIEEALSEDLVY